MKSFSVVQSITVFHQRKQIDLEYDIPDWPGEHNFKFSITSHQPGWKNGFHFGVESNHPFPTLLRAEKQKGNLPTEKSFVSTSNPFAVISTLKKAEDDNNMVLRIQEAEGSDKSVSIKLNRKMGKIYKMNMIEENPIELKQSGKLIQIPLGKNSVDTYKIKN